MSDVFSPELAAAFDTLRNNPATAPMLPALEPKFIEYCELVRVNDRHVFDVLNNNDKDPKNPEIQDAAWERAIEEGTATPAMVAAEKLYQKAVEQMEKKRKELRDAVLADVPTFIGESLPEAKVKELRNLVNSGKSTIIDNGKGLQVLSDMVSTMLTAMGTPMEKPLIELIPQPASLHNSRGKKGSGVAAGAGSKSTRVIAVAIEGKPIVRTQKKRDTGETVTKRAHINHIAEDLSRKFNASQFEGNEVTSEEVEIAYYNSKGYTESSIAELRAHSTDMPVTHEFDFTKNVEVQNPNDDSTTVIPVTVKLSITRWTADSGEGDTDTESADESNTPAQTEESAANA